MTKEQFLNAPYRIGFTKSFPVVNKIQTYNVTKKCRNYDISFDVHVVELGYGENLSIGGIVTDEVNISKRLLLGGFASMCNYDESDTMRQGVLQIAEELNVTIQNEICTWPFVKVIISN